MYRSSFNLLLISLVGLLGSCTEQEPKVPENGQKIAPTLRTEPVQFDTDDPAIWYNANDPANSLILGTDKEVGGGLYVFDLDGKILTDKTVYGLSYPNNVDVEYGFQLLDSSQIDIAITVERPLKRVRVFKLPEMEAIDGGGLPVFEDEPDSLWQLPMGVGLYKHPRTAEIFVVLSRKSGPTNGEYLWQYQLTPTDSNLVALELLRKFGKFSGGEGEIEAILVDDAMGYIYYSDELAGIRKYYADPALGNEELALFGQEDFAEDREGIALWPTSDTSGYIIVSNQQANSFNIYDRNPEGHQHQLIKEWQLSTIETDGCDLIAQPLGAKFPRGVFVAMSEDTTFHFYALEDLP